MVGLFAESNTLLKVGGELISFDPTALAAMQEAAEEEINRINYDPDNPFYYHSCMSVIENDNVLYIRDIWEWEARVRIPDLHKMPPATAAAAVRAAYKRAEGLVDAWWRLANIYKIRTSESPKSYIEMPGIFAGTTWRRQKGHRWLFAHIEGGQTINGRPEIVVTIDHDFD